MSLDPLPNADPVLDWHAELVRRGITYVEFQWGKRAPRWLRWERGGIVVDLCETVAPGVVLLVNEREVTSTGVVTAVENPGVNPDWTQVVKIRRLTAREVLDAMNTDMMMLWIDELNARDIAFENFAWSEAVNAPMFTWSVDGIVYSVRPEPGMYSAIALYRGTRRIEVVHTMKGTEYRPVARVARDLFQRYKP